jgi:twitching motility protein PilT
MLPNEPPAIETLGIPVKVIKEFCNLSHGLVLICGPVGTGKTTTLASIINYINRTKSCHIISIEDPIEYVHPNILSMVHQREVHRDTPNFSDALKYILREDPNIVVVGEMRDLETIASAITIAETGHLVIATCHTPNTLQTVERIVSIFPENQQSQIFTQLANCLQGVLAQRLVPSANKKDRILATELLIMNTAVRKHIRDKELHQLLSVIQMGKKQGMHSIDDSLQELYESGEITYDAAISNSYNPQILKSRLHKDHNSQ